MPEVEVCQVYRTKNGVPRIVEIRVGNVIFQFVRQRNKIKFGGKWSLAQVLDPGQVYVSKEMFTQALRKAAAILFPRKKSSRQLPLF
jgi:hypothetical protein